MHAFSTYVTRGRTTHTSRPRTGGKPAEGTQTVTWVNLASDTTTDDMSTEVSALTRSISVRQRATVLSMTKAWTAVVVAAVKNPTSTSSRPCLVCPTWAAKAWDWATSAALESTRRASVATLTPTQGQRRHPSPMELLQCRSRHLHRSLHWWLSWSCTNRDSRVTRNRISPTQSEMNTEVWRRRKTNKVLYVPTVYARRAQRLVDVTRTPDPEVQPAISVLSNLFQVVKRAGTHKNRTWKKERMCAVKICKQKERAQCAGPSSCKRQRNPDVPCSCQSHWLTQHGIFKSDSKNRHNSQTERSNPILILVFNVCERLKSGITQETKMVWNWGTYVKRRIPGSPKCMRVELISFVKVCCGRVFSPIW